MYNKYNIYNIHIVHNKQYLQRHSRLIDGDILILFNIKPNGKSVSNVSVSRLESHGNHIGLLHENIQLLIQLVRDLFIHRRLYQR